MRLTALIAICTVFCSANYAIAQDCYESSIVAPRPFMGNHDEVFKLSNGSIWQVQYEYEHLYEYYPDVIACPSRGKLIVGDKVLNVKILKHKNLTSQHNENLIESQIDGEFNGWEGETIIKLTNGQIWQQSEYYYAYHYAYMPRAYIYRSGNRYKMKVEGVNKSVGVVRLR